MLSVIFSILAILVPTHISRLEQLDTLKFISQKYETKYREFLLGTEQRYKIGVVE